MEVYTEKRVHPMISLRETRGLLTSNKLMHKKSPTSDNPTMSTVMWQIESDIVIVS